MDAAPPPDPPVVRRVEGLPERRAPDGRLEGLTWFDVSHVELDPAAYVLPAAARRPGAPGYRFGTCLPPALIDRFATAVGVGHAVLPYADESALFAAAAAGRVDVLVVGLDDAESSDNGPPPPGPPPSADDHAWRELLDRWGDPARAWLRAWAARHGVDWASAGRRVPLVVYAGSDGPGTDRWRTWARASRAARAPAAVVVAGRRAGARAALQAGLDAVWVEDFVVAVQRQLFRQFARLARLGRLTRGDFGRARRLLDACANPAAYPDVTYLARSGHRQRPKAPGRVKRLERVLADAGVAPPARVLRAVRVGHLYHLLRAPDLGDPDRPAPAVAAGFGSSKAAEVGARAVTGYAPREMARALSPADLLAAARRAIVRGGAWTEEGGRRAYVAGSLVPPYFPDPRTVRPRWARPG